MGKKRFFGFVVGTAAAAAGVCLIKKKGGLHVSFDVDSPRLGESVAEWKAKHAAEPGASGVDGGESGHEEAGS